MSPREAADALRECCGSARWVEEMVSHRPFESADDLLATADGVWEKCREIDWLDAFNHHPRIGGADSRVAQTVQARSWSSEEQARVADSSQTVREELDAVNQAYEKNFGHIYIVCAAGKPAEELLRMARERLKNSARVELRVAAEEQRKITRLRLSRLLGADT